MIDNPKVIPIAVVVAVGLFLLRELLELIRRYRSDARKLHAIRRFVSVECERNNFAVDRLKRQVSQIDEALNTNLAIVIEQTQRGIPRLKVESSDGDFNSSPISPIHTAALERYLFDAATLDSRLFYFMERTLETLTEARHVRDSMIEYAVSDTHWFGGFNRYATRELEKAEDAMGELHLNCTSEPLVHGRVR